MKAERKVSDAVRLSCFYCGDFRFKSEGESMVCQSCGLKHEYWKGRFLPEGSELTIPDDYGMGKNDAGDHP